MYFNGVFDELLSELSLVPGLFDDVEAFAEAFFEIGKNISISAL